MIYLSNVLKVGVKIRLLGMDHSPTAKALLDIQCVFCVIYKASPRAHIVYAVQYDAGWAIKCLWLDNIKFEAGFDITLKFKMMS